jgi:hypothetical protein
MGNVCHGSEFQWRDQIGSRNRLRRGVSTRVQADGPRQQLTINAIAIQLESGVIEDEVDATRSFFTGILDHLPQMLHVISENVALGRSQMIASCGLERTDLLFSHVDQE